MVTYTKQIILTLHNTNNEGNQGEIICRNTKKGFESVPNLLKSGIWFESLSPEPWFYENNTVQVWLHHNINKHMHCSIVWSSDKSVTEVVETPTSPLYRLAVLALYLN